MTKLYTNLNYYETKNFHFITLVYRIKAVSTQSNFRTPYTDKPTVTVTPL